MSNYDSDLQKSGYCGHICPGEAGNDNPFTRFCCTRAADHILDGEPLHQAVQLFGPAAGRVNGAWEHDGTPAMPPVDMTPIQTCGLEQPLDPQVRAQVALRIAVVERKVDALILEYQTQHSDDPARDLLKNCQSLFASFTEQAADPNEALQLACEALALMVRKLSGVDQIPAA